MRMADGMRNEVNASTLSPVTVRAARPTDLEAVLVVAERRRRQYAGYQPQFWNPAADAVTRQRGVRSVSEGDFTA